MANIARSAENFYGIVIAPGEEFSYNHYLGEISAEQGYETGLIIFGGQTIEGIGGGVCQVSTTLYQAAFWGGYELGDRWQHGYRVSYYEDGLGPDGLPNVGMDATIYSPVIDFTFTNNTPHHLLIENYYNEGSQSLTFKIYSTSIGRKVERELYIWNETDPRPTEYRYNPEWEGEDLKQVEWAAGGADVQIIRNVYNFAGALRDQNIINSSYVPWLNIFEYGDNTDRTLLPLSLRD
jgi:vancomycin resistance protein YoaR